MSWSATYLQPANNPLTRRLLCRKIVYRGLSLPFVAYSSFPFLFCSRIALTKDSSSSFTEVPTHLLESKVPTLHLEQGHLERKSSSFPNHYPSITLKISPINLESQKKRRRK